MKVKYGVALLALATALMAAPAAPAQVAVPQQQGGSLPLTLTGLTCTLTGTTTPAPCTLTATLTGFTAQGGQLFAVVEATLTNLTTNVSQTVQLLIPVTQAQGSCTILDLTLGPIHLDLLGLVVDTNQIHVTITAQQGPGKLLGNLLCSVAHLLDSQTSPQGLAQILNNILGLL